MCTNPSQSLGDSPFSPEDSAISLGESVYSSDASLLTTPRESLEKLTLEEPTPGSSPQEESNLCRDGVDEHVIGTKSADSGGACYIERQISNPQPQSILSYWSLPGEKEHLEACLKEKEEELEETKKTLENIEEELEATRTDLREKLKATEHELKTALNEAELLKAAQEESRVLLKAKEEKLQAVREEKNEIQKELNEITAKRDRERRQYVDMEKKVKELKDHIIYIEDNSIHGMKKR